MVSVFNQKTINFIKKAVEIHGDAYSYKLVDLSNIINHDPIFIICKKCNNCFESSYNRHIIKKAGCNPCSYKKRGEKRSKGTEEFIKESIKINGNDYDYSNVEYVNNHTKVTIICKIHGEFKQTPDAHIGKLKQGCPKCRKGIQCSRISIEWLEFMSKIHNTYIQHANNEGEYFVNIKKNVDGYSVENNTVYEFHGDFWHGNPKLYNLDTVNPKTETTYRELLNDTLKNENLILSLNYNLITIWENDWKNHKKLMKEIKKKIKLVK